MGPTFMFPALFRQFNYIQGREEDIFKEYLNNAFSCSCLMPKRHLEHTLPGFQDL